MRFVLNRHIFSRMEQKSGQQLAFFVPYKHKLTAVAQNDRKEPKTNVKRSQFCTMRGQSSSGGTKWIKTKQTPDIKKERLGALLWFRKM